MKNLCQVVIIVTSLSQYVEFKSECQELKLAIFRLTGVPMKLSLSFDLNLTQTPTNEIYIALTWRSLGWFQSIGNIRENIFFQTLSELGRSVKKTQVKVGEKRGICLLAPSLSHLYFAVPTKIET